MRDSKDDAAQKVAREKCAGVSAMRKDVFGVPALEFRRTRRFMVAGYFTPPFGPRQATSA